MRIVRLLGDDGAPRYGIVEGETVYACTGEPYQGILDATAEVGPLDQVQLLPPAAPGKVVCVGLNYAAHAAELGIAIDTMDEPVIFLKPPSAVIGPGQPIVIANPTHRTDFEAELAMVIGRPARKVDEANALDYVLGFTAANDVCDRVIQQKDGQWIRAKGYDTYCPLGPWIETDFDPANAMVRSRLNGELRQEDSTAHMIFTPAWLVAFISRVMTLDPGDVILTGTPHGIGPMLPGDQIAIEIDGIGALVNPVVA